MPADPRTMTTYEAYHRIAALADELAPTHPEVASILRAVSSATALDEPRVISAMHQVVSEFGRRLLTAMREKLAQANN